MKIENTEVHGFMAAIRGMRNPLNSWDKSDSTMTDNHFWLGANDKRLATNLIMAGSEHSKFMRFITVWFDIELPLYVWKEFDTYKFAEKNSCSTMHKITSKLLTKEDFEIDSIDDHDIETIELLNLLISDYKKTSKEDTTTRKEIFRKIIQKLPSSYLQKRTVITNYAELRNMYKQRKNHKLIEWRIFCDWIETLPQSRLILL